MDIDIIYNESCIEVLKRFEENSIDAIVTDPPYGLEFMGKGWDKLWDKRKDTDYKRKGFGKSALAAPVYRAGKQAQDFHYKWATECLRVIKPGGNLLSFGGARTYHRMVCAIEDAGFEIRDCIMWVYGSGFPKSLNIGKQLDGVLGKQAKGFNTAGGKEKFDKQDKSFRSDYSYIYRPSTSEAKLWEGYGTGLKPAYEPICLAMKPLEGTFAENCLKWGVGGLNIGQCRVSISQVDKEMLDAKASINNHGVNFDVALSRAKGTATPANSQGRFPANFIHDGSQEVMELFPDRLSSGLYKKTGKQPKSDNSFVRNWERDYDDKNTYAGDSDSAARFFYCAKASKRERGENNIHPTIKPLALMEYLVKLVTRPGHIVLDPFIGSGTTAIAAINTNRHYLGCELDKGYYDIAVKRIERVDI